MQTTIVIIIAARSDGSVLKLKGKNMLKTKQQKTELKRS